MTRMEDDFPIDHGGLPLWLGQDYEPTSHGDPEKDSPNGDM